MVFCEESYSCNSQPVQYQKNKIDKDNFRKNNNKNNIEKHCSNPHCFKEKITKLNSQSA